MSTELFQQLGIADRVLPTECAAKVFVLLTYCGLVESGACDPARRVLVPEDFGLHGSGVLRHVRPGLNPTLEDLAWLMTIVSDNVATALKIVMDEQGIALSRRRITLSTSGVVPMIAKVGDVLDVNLAVSLHAVSDAVLDAVAAYAGDRGVHRVAGVDRYETAVAVSELAFPPSVSVAYVASGTTFAALTVFVSYVNFRFRRLRLVLDGQPIVLVMDGEVIDGNLRRERMTRDELEAEVRLQQVASISDVSLAVLETGGVLSVIPKSSS